MCKQDKYYDCNDVVVASLTSCEVNEARFFTMTTNLHWIKIYISYLKRCLMCLICPVGTNYISKIYILSIFAVLTFVRFKVRNIHLKRVILVIWYGYLNNRAPFSSKWSSKFIGNGHISAAPVGETTRVKYHSRGLRQHGEYHSGRLLTGVSLFMNFVGYTCMLRFSACNETNVVHSCRRNDSWDVYTI